MLKHTIAHRSNTSLRGMCSPQQGVCPSPTTSLSSFSTSSTPRRGSLATPHEVKVSPYRRASSTPTSGVLPPRRRVGHLKEEDVSRCFCDFPGHPPDGGHFPSPLWGQNDNNNNNNCENGVTIGLSPSDVTYTPKRGSFSGGQRPSFVEAINNHQDAHPRPIHEYIEDNLPFPTRGTQGTHSNQFLPQEVPRTPSQGYKEPFPTPPTPGGKPSRTYSASNSPYPPSRGSSFSSSVDLNGVSRSCTLPRRETFLKDDLRRTSVRSNASSCSLLSSASCSSLNSYRQLSSRSTSTSSLLETVPVKIYLRRLRCDMEYKTVCLSLRTTCRELVLLLLAKFRLRHRDPNLFFVLMEVTVRAPSDGAPVRRQLVLEDSARPAELQQCRPKGEANFSIGVRRGGLIRVHDAILNPGSQYKSLMVAFNTTSVEVVQLILKCYNSPEDPRHYALHEVRKNPYTDRPLPSPECPLRVQWDWPKASRNNYAFVLRRNLAYAFSLKSRMSWRRSLDQSSTDTETDLEEFPNHGGGRPPSSSSSMASVLPSTPDSRTSSVSSSSSVASSCSSSGKSSRDSGYLGSPFTQSKVPASESTSTLTSTSTPESMSTSTPTPTSTSSPAFTSTPASTSTSTPASTSTSTSASTSTPASTSTLASTFTPVSTSTPTSTSISTPSIASESASTSTSKATSEYRSECARTSSTSKCQVMSLPESASTPALESTSTSVPSFASTSTPTPTSVPISTSTSKPASAYSGSSSGYLKEVGYVKRSVLPITASVSKLSLNSSLPSLKGTPSSPIIPVPPPREKTPKPRQRTVITITSTCRSPVPGASGDLLRRYLRPVIPPPSLRIPPLPPTGSSSEGGPSIGESRTPPPYPDAPKPRLQVGGVNHTSAVSPSNSHQGEEQAPPLYPRQRVPHPPPRSTRQEVLQAQFPSFHRETMQQDPKSLPSSPRFPYKKESQTTPLSHYKEESHTTAISHFDDAFGTSLYSYTEGAQSINGYPYKRESEAMSRSLYMNGPQAPPRSGSKAPPPSSNSRLMTPPPSGDSLLMAPPPSAEKKFLDAIKVLRSLRDPLLPLVGPQSLKSPLDGGPEGS